MAEKCVVMLTGPTFTIAALSNVESRLPAPVSLRNLILGLLKFCFVQVTSKFGHERKLKFN